MVLACLMPVVFNGLVIGAVITSAYEGKKVFEAVGLYALNAIWVSLGEAAVMLLIGFPFMKFMEKRKLLTKFMTEKE